MVFISMEEAVCFDSVVVFMVLIVTVVVVVVDVAEK